MNKQMFFENDFENQPVMEKRNQDVPLGIQRNETYVINAIRF